MTAVLDLRERIPQRIPERRPAPAPIVTPRRRPFPWWPEAGIVGLVVATATLAAVRGVGFILDDFSSLEGVHFHGFWSAAGAGRGDERPMTVALFGLTYGFLGEHPLAHLVVLTAVRVATALLLLALLRKVVAPHVGVAVTVAWVLLPNHFSLEVWSAAIAQDLALLCLLAGVLVFTRRPSPQRDRCAAALLLIGALSYEAIVPIGLVLLVVMPLWTRRRVDWQAIAWGAPALVLPVLWAAAHLPSSKGGGWHLVDLSPVLGTQFGFGIAPAGPIAMLTLVGALVGLALLARAALRGVAATDTVLLAGAGFAVIILGALPFLSYSYEPLGAGDRVNLISSIGGAMVWTALLVALWHARRAVAVTVAVALVTMALVRRWEATELWAGLFHDGDAIAAAVAANPVAAVGGEIVIGPTVPLCENTTLYNDDYIATQAVRVATGNPMTTARLARSEAEFALVPPAQRLDLRTLNLTCPP